MADTSFSSLLHRARSGDPEATMRVIAILEPTLRKNARMARTDDAYSDLLVWLLKALRKYRGPPRAKPEEATLQNAPDKKLGSSDQFR